MSPPAHKRSDRGSLQDRGQSADRPDTPEERRRYDMAVLTRDEIGRRIRLWPINRARAGAEYDALIAEWKAACTAADLAFDAMIEAAVSSEGPV